MAKTRGRRAKEGAMLAAVLCILFAAVCSGFTVHKRHPNPHLHPHHHTRHHGHRIHHPLSPESTVSPETLLDSDLPEPGNPEEIAVNALLEALESAALNDAVWGSGGNDVDAAVPLFMKLLLHDTEKGAIFTEYSQPVAPPSPGSSSNKTLASCVQPSRVSVGRAGAMMVEFPAKKDVQDRGWWLVLALQPRVGGLRADDATLSVYVAGSDDPRDIKMIAEHSLPNATFVAVDVTKAVRELAGSWSRFLIDVRASEASDGASGSLPSAATVLEVAGWERGPLLVSALNWGEDSSEEGSMRVWDDLPADLLHPPRSRSRRRSHRRTTTTTEGYTSAENPLRNAATADLTSGDHEQDAVEAGRADEQTCHLEEWTVSTEDLGWQFIIQPRTIDINFCVGRCPPLLLDQRFNASTNAIARTAIKKDKGLGANIPDAQCVPIRYKPIALLMRVNGGIDLFNSYDLSADRCGCR